MNDYCLDCDHYHPIDENNGECPLHGFVGDFSVGCKDFRQLEEILYPDDLAICKGGSVI